MVGWLLTWCAILIGQASTGPYEHCQVVEKLVADFDSISFKNCEVFEFLSALNYSKFSGLKNLIKVLNYSRKYAPPMML